MLCSIKDDASLALRSTHRSAMVAESSPDRQVCKERGAERASIERKGERSLSNIEKRGWEGCAREFPYSNYKIVFTKNDSLGGHPDSQSLPSLLGC